MQLGNSSTHITSGNRNILILAVILTILIIILLGVLYFMKQRDLGEETSGTLSATKAGKSDLKELMELTSAPENNPDIKPNPQLTALTSAPEDNLQAKADAGLIANLTAPKK